jgi:hypothetical protein
MAELCSRANRPPHPRIFAGWAMGAGVAARGVAGGSVLDHPWRMAWVVRWGVRSLAWLGLGLVAGAAWGADGPSRSGVTRPAVASVPAASVRPVVGSAGARSTGRSIVVARATPGVTPSICIPAWTIDASGIRRLPDRCPDESAQPAAPAPVAADDALGASARPERMRVSSAGVAASSAAPPSASAKATRRPARAATRMARSAARCEQPFWTDARGVRRLRPGCL